MSSCPSELIVSAAQQAVESLADPSAVSRPPFQCFADAHSAQCYFAKQILDLLTPYLLQVVQSDANNDLTMGWRAQAKLMQYLLGSQFTNRFISQENETAKPEYRAVQRLVGEVVRELADCDAKEKLRSCLGDMEERNISSNDDDNGDKATPRHDSVDAPTVVRRGCAWLVSHASAKNRGRRNEDRLLVSAFSPDANSQANFLAVLDGHGGSDGADLAASYLLPLFLSYSSHSDSDSKSELVERLRRTFVDADAKLGEAASQCGASGGATCTVCIISGDQLTVAWAGDSEAWLVHSNGLATQLTAPPHRPSIPAERSRVESAGGFVMDGNPPRLNGVLAVTRSLGDRGVTGSTPEPEVVHRQLKLSEDADGSKDVCVVLASDGLWDAVAPNDAAAALVAMQADDSTKSEAAAANALIDMAVAAGSTDNVTVVVAWL
ncbi:hypothetical protein BOX15_Mlig016718g3 [Macrostomum lignano]|uniref:Uncharacterized protein n=2 Tax=Macrostomum lignano TaxID=282301 RepID=A0A267GJ78_9PLAT|nr:hypothetical protein BOX15_Mlig016718g3 [Macrostomum lignano]